MDHTTIVDIALVNELLDVLLGSLSFEEYIGTKLLLMLAEQCRNGKTVIEQEGQNVTPQLHTPTWCLLLSIQRECFPGCLLPSLYGVASGVVYVWAHTGMGLGIV